MRERGLLLTSGVITADSARRSVTMTKRDANTWLITRPALLQVLDESVPDTVDREQRHVEDASTLGGDLVVAADGARNVVRTRVWGDEPRDTGVVAIRGVLDTPPDTPLDQMHEFWGDGMLFGVGPNRLPHSTGTNWYASTRRGEDTPVRALAWARDAYAGFPALVRATLSAADPERTVVNTILESRRARELVKDRYVLVGDAAHAMSPNLGRGACEAMVDAIFLGEALKRAWATRSSPLREGATARGAAYEGSGGEGATARPLRASWARRRTGGRPNGVRTTQSRDDALGLVGTLTTGRRTRTISSHRAESPCTSRFTQARRRSAMNRADHEPGEPVPLADDVDSMQLRRSSAVSGDVEVTALGPASCHVAASRPPRACGPWVTTTARDTRGRRRAGG